MIFLKRNNILNLSLSIILGLFIHSGARASDRIALIIGNSQYENLSSLRNPKNDAKAIAIQLRKLGFDIIRPIQQNSDIQIDLTLEDFLNAREILLEKAEGKQLIFVYYSGHGASLGDDLLAHILPVNVKNPNLQSKSTLALLQKQSISLDELLDGLDTRAELTIAVFDACREMLELEQTKGVFDKSQGNTSSWRGLNRISRKHKRIIAYSGGYGQVVSDGDKKYSPYTEKLLETLRNKPFLEIGDLFRDVATQVSNFTHQNPVIEIQGVPPNKFYFSQKDKLCNSTKPPSNCFVDKTKTTSTKQDNYYGVFKDNGDFTISDSKNKLMWKKCNEGQKNDFKCSDMGGGYTWKEAMDRQISFAGYTDWRLPELNELNTLLNFNNKPTMDLLIFPNTSDNQSLWSSTTKDAAHSYSLFLGNGDVEVDHKENIKNVRLVRDVN